MKTKLKYDTSQVETDGAVRGLLFVVAIIGCEWMKDDGTILRITPQAGNKLSVGTQTVWGTPAMRQDH